MAQRRAFALTTTVALALLITTGPMPALAAPQTVIDALKGNTTPGWSSATLADGRPVALYRGSEVPMPVTLAFSCLPDGRPVITGGPSPLLTIQEGERSIVVPINSSRVGLRGASAFSLYAANPNSNDPAEKITLQTEAGNIPINDASELLKTTANWCNDKFNQRATQNKIAIDYFVWSGSPGTIIFAAPDSDSVGITLQCQGSALKIISWYLPKSMPPGRQTVLVVNTTSESFKLRAQFEKSENADDVAATVPSPKGLLSALAAEDGLGVGVNGTIEAVLPTQGLGGLIERHLSACR